VTTAATIVTYNRSGDLRVCLTAIGQLDPPVDEVIVIDNASTDDTAQVLASEFPHISVHFEPRNIGGAGGFSVALQLAMDRGHSHAWLMDDDAIPTPSSYGPLRTLIEDPSIDPQPSFLASHVIQPDGRDLTSHIPPSTDDTIEASRAARFACVPVQYASFVGVMINLAYARRTFLPVAEFFLILDDLEYTSRLGNLAPGWLVPDSRIVHPDKKLLTRYNPRWWMGVRNSLWIAHDRRLASAHVRHRRLRGVVRPILSSAVRAPSKTLFIRQLFDVLVQVTREPPVLRRPAGRQG
jgi:rhamnopyranosyl-N-acetylglucosaminyl-diphospho-decaprenol beta-1,3/1,4-galactofuranosyltransferase